MKKDKIFYLVMCRTEVKDKPEIRKFVTREEAEHEFNINPLAIAIGYAEVKDVEDIKEA